MSERLRILIVDGNEADRLLVRRAVAASDIADADLADASTAADALDRLARGEPFDCLLMENHLPDRPALQVLQQLRADAANANAAGPAAQVPVIVMTDRGSEQLAVDLMKAGAADYLAKARISAESLARSVRNAVRLRRAESTAARAAEELREQTRVAQALHRIGMRLAGERDLQRLVQLVTDEATALVDAAFGAFFYNVLDDQGAWYMLYTLSGMGRENFEKFPMPRNTEIFAPTFGGHATVRLDDVTKDPRYGKNAPFHGMPPGHLPIRSYLAVPVVSGRAGNVIGGLFFGHPQPARFAERDEKIVEGIASQAAVAIDNARLNEQLRRGEERYRFMADSIPQIVWTAGADGQPDWFNRRWLDYTGLTAEQVVGAGWQTIVHPDDLETCLARWNHSARTGEEYGIEYRLRAADSSYRWHLGRAAPMRDQSGKIIKWFGTCTDIHDQKTAETQLVAANAAKDQFLAVLSHELRTPLMPVLLTVQSLQESAATMSPAEHNDALDVIRRNVELEARLIDDLLDLTRISKGKLQLNFDTVDVHAALRSAMDICSIDVVGKQLGTTMDLAATRHHVRGDSARLQQVFWNLIKNAIKFTPPHGHVTVHTYDDPGGALKIAITDTGIGIEPAHVARIFDAFEQADRSVTRQFGGLGLGLAISKALVDLHGGKLSAQSAGPNLGSTFMIALRPTTAPTTAPAPAPDDSAPSPAIAFAGLSSAAPSESPAPSAESINILLVDDHRDTNRAMARLLERLGYRVRTADSVASALHVAAGDEPIDLLISDIGLPDGSGLELMQQLLSRRPIKGIALSGFGMEEDVKRSKEAGFYEHLTKPINFKRLETAIRELTHAR